MNAYPAHCIKLLLPKLQRLAEECSMLISKHNKIFGKTLYLSYCSCILSIHFWSETSDIFDIRQCNFFYKYVGVCDVVVNKILKLFDFYESIIF